MDKNAIKTINKEHNGETYSFPIGVRAENVETDVSRQFISETEKKGIKEKIGEIEKTIELIHTLLGEKADILTINRTVYVAENGNDAGGKGTEQEPFRTIQHAIDNIPVINGNYEYTINVSAGNYQGFIASNCSATINLTGNITLYNEGEDYPTRINDSTIKIMGNDHELKISGKTYKALLYIHNSGTINTYKTSMKIAGDGKGSGIEIVSNGGFSHPGSNIEFQQIEIGVGVRTNSSFHAGSLSGTASIGIKAMEGGIATFGTNNINATTPIQTESGGRVYGGAQEGGNS